MALTRRSPYATTSPTTQQGMQSGYNVPSVDTPTSMPSASVVASADNSFTPPLHTEGRNIVDATGKVVRLASTALGYGGGIPFGIWWQGHSIGGVLDSMKASGFNSIRLPLNMQTFAQPNYQMNLGNLAVNHPELAQAGVQPVQILDYFLNECANRGIGVILDMHGYGDGDFKPSIWYTHTEGANGASATNIVGLNDPNNVWTDSVNETNFIQWWQAMANRYKDHPAVIGADLLNEPHDKVTWGDGNIDTDWRLAAERIGGAIQQVAPDWLIVVEGMDADVNRGGTIGDAWWGGNLSKVASAPVRLNNVVYSPHDYGPSVWGNWWLSDPAAMRELWEREWGYIARNDIAPIWIGEFGQPNLNVDNGGGQQVRQMLDYTDEIGASWSYWIWDDGASSDTGGLMAGGDGKPLTPFPEKMEVLKPYMNITEGWGSGQKLPSKSGWEPQLSFKDEGRPGFPPAPYAGYTPVTPTLSTTSPLTANTPTTPQAQPIDPDPLHAPKVAPNATTNTSTVVSTKTPTLPTATIKPISPTPNTVSAAPHQPYETILPTPQLLDSYKLLHNVPTSPTPSQTIHAPTKLSLKRAGNMKPLSTSLGLGVPTVDPQPLPLASDATNPPPQPLNWVNKDGIQNTINDLLRGP